MSRNITIVVVILIILLMGFYLVWLRNRFLSTPLNMEASVEEVAPTSPSPSPQLSPSPVASSSAKPASSLKSATPSAKVK